VLGFDNESIRELPSTQGQWSENSLIHKKNDNAHIRKRTSQTTWLATKSVDAFREYLSGDLAVRKTLA
jgi:hypothetical protein